MTTRTCRRCSKTKLLTEFKSDKTCAEGRRFVCLACSKTPASTVKNQPAGSQPKTLVKDNREWKRQKDREYRLRKKQKREAARAAEEEGVRKERALEKSRVELSRRQTMARTNAIKSLILNHMTEFTRLYDKEKRALGVGMSEPQWISLHTIDDSSAWNNTAPDTPELMANAQRVAV
jgi:hypothetical protein